jgi:hypothetical protein
VQVALAFVLMLANNDATPSWNEGDFFGAKFAGNATGSRSTARGM